jgi:hypothetical protein
MFLNLIHNMAKEEKKNKNKNKKIHHMALADA